MSTKYLEQVLDQARNRLVEAAGIIRELERDRVLARDPGCHLIVAQTSVNRIIGHVKSAMATIKGSES
jgi:hypothetical protein